MDSKVLVDKQTQEWSKKKAPPPGVQVHLEASYPKPRSEKCRLAKSEPGEPEE